METSYVIVNSGTSTARIYCKNNGGEYQPEEKAEGNKMEAEE